MNNLTTQNSILDGFFHDKLPRLFVRPLHGESLPSPERIKIDINEKDDRFYINAEIPGVAKENIDLSISDEILTIRAEIKQHDEHKEDKVLHSERYFGSVSRSFQLPEKIKVDEVEASYENGILKLVVPKEINTRTKKLEIK